MEAHFIAVRLVGRRHCLDGRQLSHGEFHRRSAHGRAWPSRSAARPRNIAATWPSSGSARRCPTGRSPVRSRARSADHLGAGGATSFVFEHGEVFGWRMTIQGSLVRILDSVLPHEVTHTIFATHFRQPLPRWADEGACTTVEHHQRTSQSSK